MATEVLIPKLGMTMEEGTVAEWHIPDGGEVKTGESIYRLETEKIEFEVEAESDGTVRHLVEEGATLPCGAVVAYVLAPGEALPAGVAPVAPVAAAPQAAASAQTATSVPSDVAIGERVAATPAARRLAEDRGIDLRRVTGTGPNSRITEADVLAAAERPIRAQPAAAPPEEAPSAASPVARRLAEQLGVDLATVKGTGPGGRITREDVEASSAAPPPARAPAEAAAGGARSGAAIPIRGMRKVIAERMHASLQEMAQLTLSMDAWMDEATKLRAQLVEEWAPDGVRPSFTDLVLRAVAKVVSRHPLANAELRGNEILLHSDVHLGMAVAVDAGLVVPVIRHADRLSLKEIAAESSRLAEGARAGKLGPDDYAGATICVTPLGMFGVDVFTPIINPPNSVILGVGRIHDGLDWEADRPLKRQVMTLSLTWDHRVLDGVPAARFVRAVKALLEAPYRLLV